MAKKNQLNNGAKVMVVARARLISRSTNEIFEKGAIFYANPETADELITLGLVELSEQHDKTEITQQEEEK
ncbi:MAG: hypothetical protein PHQ36_05845 [Anaerolineales bacterium]|nr:hypothetical protein [Anaerolineales bacterium]